MILPYKQVVVFVRSASRNFWFQTDGGVSHTLNLSPEHKKLLVFSDLHEKLYFELVEIVREA